MNAIEWEDAVRSVLLLYIWQEKPQQIEDKSFVTTNPKLGFRMAKHRHSHIQTSDGATERHMPMLN